MEEQRLYFIDQIKSYDETFKLDEEVFINCYSKKQLEAVSSKEDRKFLGEFAKDSKKDKIAQFEAKDDVYPMYEYKAHNRFAFAEKGFVKCADTDNTYIIFLKDVLWIRVLIIALLLALLGGGIFAATKYLTSSAPPLDKVLTSAAPPDATPTIDPNAVETDSTDKTANDKNGKTHAQVSTIHKIELPANSRIAYTKLQNNEGNPSATFTLTINGKEIAKTGLVPGGRAINQLTLNESLPQGTYNGVIVQQFFDSNGNLLNSAKIQVQVIVT
ncbi:MAG: hypothetical protein LBJ95_05225 [Oscillospiraceae bacterium]|jgi:hypothetical protein|nr:hypothetical protein [Oscillospiraceae bacterium]